VRSTYLYVSCNIVWVCVLACLHQEAKADALKHKDAGNKLFSQAKFLEAIESYTKAIETYPVKSDTNVAIFYSNRASCHMNLVSAP
jgi:hypothetical protein